MILQFRDICCHHNLGVGSCCQPLVGGETNAAAHCMVHRTVPVRGWRVVSWKRSLSFSLEPRNVTLNWKKSRGADKLSILRCCHQPALPGWDPNGVTSVPERGRGKFDTAGEGYVKTAERFEGTGLEIWNDVAMSQRMQGATRSQKKGQILCANTAWHASTMCLAQWNQFWTPGLQNWENAFGYFKIPSLW